MAKPPQELLLDLIECSGRWNSFDGPKIAATLRANSPFWRAVTIGNTGGDIRFNAEGEACGVNPDLGLLGGLLEECVVFDLLWAIPTAGHTESLEKLFRSFHADSIRWLPLEDCVSAFGRITPEDFISAGHKPDRAVLEAWWD
jgi:hypothetical protein